MRCYNNEAYINTLYNFHLGLYIKRFNKDKDASNYSLELVKFYGAILIGLGSMTSEEHYSHINFIPKKHTEKTNLISDGEE